MKKQSFVIPMSSGSHEIPWDMNILLYRGAARIHRASVIELVRCGEFGSPRPARLSFVVALYNVMLAKNIYKSKATVVKSLTYIWGFYKWCDDLDVDVTTENAVSLYFDFCEDLWGRLNIKKEISHEYAYSRAQKLADLFVRTTKSNKFQSGRDLLKKTRIKQIHNKKWILGVEAEKLNPERISSFGNVISAIATSLTPEVICGPIPIRVSLEDGRQLLLRAGLKRAEFDVLQEHQMTDRVIQRYNERRRSLPDGVPPTESRGRVALLNLRVDAELLIFVAMTRMPKQQAAMLTLEDYRWKKSGEHYEVYRVFKGRRNGEALFRCFGVYREHFLKYIKWLRSVGLTDLSNKLFPYLHDAKIPAEDRATKFESIKRVLKENDIEMVGTVQLRHHANNWLLRSGVSQEDVIKLGGVSKDVNIRHYSRPHHQEAAVQINRYFRGRDAYFSSPMGAPCESKGSPPHVIDSVEGEFVQPDCINADGCIFCHHHRDILNEDYCFKLISHVHLKGIELEMHRIDVKGIVHPAERFIKRINEKLALMVDADASVANWIVRSQEAIRAGRYHPFWEGIIRLAREL